MRAHSLNQARRVLPLLVATIVWAPASLRSADPTAKPTLVSVTKIWDKAPHCAFTDLLRWKKTWLCCFREATGHGGDNGTVRVITSPDGTNWKSLAVLKQPGIDLRDPKLSIHPDGRLMLLMGGIVNLNGKYHTRSPRVAFSHDGHTWSPPATVLAEDHWLWRVTWHKRTGWAVSKLNEGRKPRRGFLYKTRDGIKYEYVTEMETEGISETTLRFLPDDTMVALIRPRWIGLSKPPYRKWSYTDIGQPIGGPNFLITPKGTMWAAGRKYGQAAKTSLATMTGTSFQHVLELPSGGDTSYPGMVLHDGLLWMSYYSSHEGGKTSIFLAKIKL